MRTIIRDGDHEYLVDQETGEIIYTRTAEDALTSRTYDTHEVDPMVLGNALVELPKAAGRLLLCLVEHIKDGATLTRDPIRLAMDMGMSRSGAFRARDALLEHNILRNNCLNPIYAYDAPYGLANNDRWEHIRWWYRESQKLGLPPQ